MRIYRLPTELKAIIFDIDSTLYTHQEYAIYQNDIQIRHFAQLEGIPYESALNRIEMVRTAWQEKNGGAALSLGNTFCQLGYPIEESIRWREELLEPADFLARDEKLIASLEALSTNYRLACVTNNPVLVGRKTLKALGAQEFFPVVVGLDSCRVSKPHAAPFLLATEKLCCLPQECLSVGDRYHIDLELPLKLGMGGILVEDVADVYGLAEQLKSHSSLQPPQQANLQYQDDVLSRTHAILERAKIYLQEGKSCVIAIDGRAASGKTTLAASLQAFLHAEVIHMDDFFVPAELRSEERFKVPGGNIHHERFAEEVLPFLASRKPFSYQIFDCSKMDYCGKREIGSKPVRIVEGAYSCHPIFGAYADITVFSHIAAEQQRQRIRSRNGDEMLEMFLTRWIPLEEEYFSHYLIEEMAHLRV